MEQALTDGTGTERAFWRWGGLGRFGRFWKVFGEVLERFWKCFWNGFGEVLERFWKGFWRGFGEVLERFGGGLERFGGGLGKVLEVWERF